MAFRGHSERVETDSTVDFNVSILNTTDPDVEIRVHARVKNAGQFLAGNAEAVTVGPGTDADARQATDPNVGHFATGFAPRRDPAATLPSVAFEGTLQPPCLAWPSRSALTGAEQGTQRQIHLRSRTMVRIHRHLEPCIWARVV